MITRITTPQIISAVRSVADGDWSIAQRVIDVLDQLNLLGPGVWAPTIDDEAEADRLMQMQGEHRD